MDLGANPGGGVGREGEEEKAQAKDRREEVVRDVVVPAWPGDRIEERRAVGTGLFFELQLLVRRSEAVAKEKIFPRLVSPVGDLL